MHKQISIKIIQYINLFIYYKWSFGIIVLSFVYIYKLYFFILLKKKIKEKIKQEKKILVLYKIK